jgi:uncharacterized protein (DUF362 family)
LALQRRFRVYQTGIEFRKSLSGTTNPEGIRAVVELLKEKGAGKVIVSDMSGVEHVKLSTENLKGSSRELMNRSGMAKAALEAGAELYFPEEEGWNAFFEDEPIDSAHWNKGIMMPAILKETDHIILMPRCSRHVLLGSSLGMKNAVGYWRRTAVLNITSMRLPSRKRLLTRTL